MKCGSNTGMTVCSRSPWLESAFSGFILNKNESMKVEGGKGRGGEERREEMGKGKGMEGKVKGRFKNGWRWRSG